MNNKQDKLSPGALSLIALAVDYCSTIEHSEGADRDQYIARINRLLTRLYICAYDLSRETDSFVEEVLDPALDERQYDECREALSVIMADQDIYLETVVEDMRFSDTPVAQSISENLADIYQEMYNFVHSVEPADTQTQLMLVDVLIDDFRNFWGQTLCNVVRALHSAEFYHNIY